MFLLTTPFSGTQLTFIIIISVACALLLAANVYLLILFFRKRKQRKMSTEALQDRRDQLVEKLETLKNGAGEENSGTDNGGSSD